MRILIVDDQVSVAKGLQHACKKRGWSADLAFSAEEALRLVREKSFDGVVSDLRMPGLSGLEFAEELLGNGRDEKPFFILISAYLTLEDSLQALRLGVGDVFQKPFETEALVLRMEALGGLKKTAGKDVVGVAAECKTARNVIGWDEFFCVEQKATANGSRWNYFSMPKKNGVVRVGVGFDFNSAAWARVEGALMGFLENDFPPGRFLEFLKERASDLRWDELKNGMCVMDVANGKGLGVVGGNLRWKVSEKGSETPQSEGFPGAGEIDFGREEKLLFFPAVFTGECPLFFLALNSPGVTREVDLERGKLWEDLSFFGECLARGDWDYSVQIKTLSCLAEILTECAGLGLKKTSVCLDQKTFRVKGEDLAKRWSERSKTATDSEALLRLPGSEEFVRRLSGANLILEADAVCFSVSSGGLS